MNPAAAWAADRRSDPALRLMKRRALRRLTRGLPPDALIGDLGCGPGDDAAALAGRGFRIAALDRHPGMLRLARRALAPWIARGRVRIVRASFAAPPAGLRGRCDAVLGFHAANFPPGIAAFARGCARLLRPGGRAVFTTVNRWGWQDVGAGLLRFDLAHATRRFRRGGVRIRVGGRPADVVAPAFDDALRPFRAGFVIERIEPLGLLLPGTGALPGAGRRLAPRLLRLLDRLESRLAFRPLVRLADHALVIVRKR